MTAVKALVLRREAGQGRGGEVEQLQEPLASQQLQLDRIETQLQLLLQLHNKK